MAFIAKPRRQRTVLASSISNTNWPRVYATQLFSPICLSSEENAEKKHGAMEQGSRLKASGKSQFSNSIIPHTWAVLGHLMRCLLHQLNTDKYHQWREFVAMKFWFLFSAFLPQISTNSNDSSTNVFLSICSSILVHKVFDFNGSMKKLNFKIALFLLLLLSRFLFLSIFIFFNFYPQLSLFSKSPHQLFLSLIPSPTNSY